MITAHAAFTSNGRNAAALVARPVPAAPIGERRDLRANEGWSPAPSARPRRPPTYNRPRAHCKPSLAVIWPKGPYSMICNPLRHWDK
jgi:hypothetical protein